MPFVPFSYKCWVKRIDWDTGALVTENAIHDGDSGWFLLDKGNREYLNANCRLWGINAPELNDADPEARKRAVASRDWLRLQIQGKQVFVYSKALDKYGRPLVQIWLAQADFGDLSKSINKASLDAGHAVKFMAEWDK